MKKVIFQGALAAILFFATWFVLRQIDWVGIFKVQQATEKTEEKLGELIWSMIQKTDKENKNDFVAHAIDSIVSKICRANNIPKDFLKIHILDKDEVNAFALPNGHLIIYSGLIMDSGNQEELCGVISHEIAHIELRHVMKKLIQETGLAALISMTSGNSGSDVAKETVRILTSRAFDRSLEKEADIKAVDFLIAARINPEPFANFLYKLADHEGDSSKYLAWIGTHPDSRERARYIIEYCSNKKTDFSPVLSTNTWSKIKEELKVSSGLR